MKITFPKDILIIDIESSNKDLEKAEPLQIGAVLLDKDTLKEKTSFVSYIINDLSKASPQTLEINGITLEKLNGAPSINQVTNKFVEVFGKDFIFSGWVCEKDRAIFRKMMVSSDINPSDFDFHIYDIWPIAYTYLLQRGYKGSMNSEEMFQEFGLPARGHHDALEDCRFIAIILRKILEV
jgi:DNA polymerase III epsilon subunit-like protein